MQMNPTELVASRIYFQAIVPGATRCARHSLTSFLAKPSFPVGPVLLWIRCLQRCSTLPQGWHTRAVRDPAVVSFYSILQFDVVRCWPCKALSAAMWSKLGGPDDHSGHVLLCYACCWSLLCLTFRYSLALPVILCFRVSVCSLCCPVSFGELVDSSGLFLCHLFGICFFFSTLYSAIDGRDTVLPC